MCVHNEFHSIYLLLVFSFFCFFNFNLPKKLIRMDVENQMKFHLGFEFSFLFIFNAILGKSYYITYLIIIFVEGNLLTLYLFHHHHLYRTIFLGYSCVWLVVTLSFYFQIITIIITRETLTERHRWEKEKDTKKNVYNSIHVYEFVRYIGINITYVCKFLNCVSSS